MHPLNLLPLLALALASPLPQSSSSSSSSDAPHPKLKLEASSLRPSYDFIVAGGGTAGLTVADRLSEAFPDLTVLVIEYGTVEDATAVNVPPGGGPGASRMSLSGVPNPALNGRRPSVSLGMSVGGSSTVNGMFFDRGSRWDYDEWEELLGGEGEGEERWDWDGILPFFRKSVNFTEPTEIITPEMISTYGYTWSVDAAYGGTSSNIHSTFAAYQYPTTMTVRSALISAGTRAPVECAGGDKSGVCWVPASQDPMTGARSHSGVGHYLDVIDSRDNYDLLVRHKVTRVDYAESEDGAPPAVEFYSLDDDDKTPARVVATKEVILAAGSIHTPQILQRSGIARKEFLEELGIPVVADLPGVGYNFHDHGGHGVSISLSNVDRRPPVGPDAVDQFNQRPAQGPYTLAMGNTAIYIPLRNLSSTYPDLIAMLEAQIDDGSFASYLPDGSAPAVVAGYEAQLRLLLKTFAHELQPIMEAPFSSSAPGSGFLLKPASRGTILLNPDDFDDEPIVDYRTATNPIDLEVMATFFEYFRGLIASDAFQALGASESSPGEDRVPPGDKEAMFESIRERATASFMHPCCTAAMMAEELGGVVGRDLSVYKVAGLRVADGSIWPTVPGTHTSATAYATGEKAADFIIRKWSEA